jgi:putative aldouronate transport system permease protein
MIQERTVGSRLFDAFNYVFLGALGFLCVFPLIHILAVSFSDRAATTANLVTFWPINFTTLNYQEILRNGQFLRSLMISVVRVVGGTTITMLVVILTAYPLSLSADFRGKQFFKWALLFAMLFQGGLIPWYLALRSLHLLNTIWALILPGMVQVFYIIVMVSFFRRLPTELAEAATVDGASHWSILFRIYLPLSLPALATLTLFTAVDHWNAWFDALVVMKTPRNYPLQTYLQTTIVANDFSRLLANAKVSAQLSPRSLRAAQIVLATLPILALYPFLQRYFVAGLTLGSVKG